MSKFQTLAKDLRCTTIAVQGARRADSNNDIASIIFQNYDDDTKLVHDMAKIAMIDHYGSSNMNGYGDIIFNTNSGSSTSIERLRILHDGKIGIGTSTPDSMLDVVGGDITITGIGRSLVFKNDDGTVAGSITNLNGTLNLGASNAGITQTVGEYITNIPLLLTSIDSSNWVPAAAWQHDPTISGTINNLLVETFLHTTSSNVSYQMRVMNIPTNTLVAQSATLSNNNPIETPLTILPQVILSSKLELQVKHSSSILYPASIEVRKFTSKSTKTTAI